MKKIDIYNSKIYIVVILILLFISCVKTNSTKTIIEPTKISNNISGIAEQNTVEDRTIKVDFSITQKKVEKTPIKENVLKGQNHSIKYYSYQPSEENAQGDFSYLDVFGQKHIMNINQNAKKQKYEWDFESGVLSKVSPKGYKMTYGIDISKFNGNIDFEKVKNAGFEFVIIRVVYRGYGKAGELHIDQKAADNLKNAKAAGLKIGAYVFSQAQNEKEAIEEADFTLDFLKDYNLDLPVFYDPETISYANARTDNVTGEQWTKNAIVFMDKLKQNGYETGLYSNMVWQDYYFDMSQFNDYNMWYADYKEIPQTPYKFEYWQFSESGVVDGIEGAVDLDVCLMPIDQ